MISGTFSDSSSRCRRFRCGRRLRRYSWAKEMCRASSATWMAITFAMIGCSSLPSRSTSFWVWSMGSSPASTPKKNGIGSGPGTRGISGDSQRSSRGMPGTSTPIRLTISWNIRVWLHSSIASWVQYRYSGEPLGTQNA